MARPTKCRIICYFPKNTEFSPNVETNEKSIILTIDEYESN